MSEANPEPAEAHADETGKIQNTWEFSAFLFSQDMIDLKYAEGLAQVYGQAIAETDPAFSAAILDNPSRATLRVVGSMSDDRKAEFNDYFNSSFLSEMQHILSAGGSPEERRNSINADDLEGLMNKTEDFALNFLALEYSLGTRQIAVKQDTLAGITHLAGLLNYRKADDAVNFTKARTLILGDFFNNRDPRKAIRYLVDEEKLNSKVAAYNDFLMQVHREEEAAE